MDGVGWLVSIVSGLGVLASLVWIWLLARLIWYRNRVLWLFERQAAEPDGGWPSLAVVFAARNEEGHVADAARSILAQDYPDLSVLAVDDRSTDRTGAELEALAADDPRLLAIHVRELPQGWLGKVHALQAAATATPAEWLLFTDADVFFAPGSLRRSVAAAIAEGADHLVAAPDVVTEGVGERIFLSMFGLLFALKAPVWQVEDPAHPSYMGIGAFNLVRADAFQSIAGFRRLSLSVDDDMRFGQALKAAGYRTRVAAGHRLLRVRWQVGISGMIRGLEKNFFAAVGYSVPLAVLAGLGILILGAGPHLGLLAGPGWGRAICGLGVLAICLVLQAVGRQSGVRWTYGLILPVGALLCFWSLARSTWLTLARGGVRWRDHFYPLAELRAHVRGRNAWIREVWLSTR